MPFCRNCGKKIAAGAKFCSECGFQTSTQPSSPPPPPPPSPTPYQQPYTPQSPYQPQPPPKRVNIVLIVIGYIFAFLGGLVGIILGGVIILIAKDERDKRHGAFIATIAAIIFIIAVQLMFL